MPVGARERRRLIGHLLMFMGQGGRTKFVAMIRQCLHAAAATVHQPSGPRVRLDALMLRTAQNAGLIPRSITP